MVGEKLEKELDPEGALYHPDHQSHHNHCSPKVITKGQYYNPNSK